MITLKVTACGMLGSQSRAWLLDMTWEGSECSCRTIRCLHGNGNKCMWHCLTRQFLWWGHSLHTGCRPRYSPPQHIIQVQLNGKANQHHEAHRVDGDALGHVYQLLGKAQCFGLHFVDPALHHNSNCNKADSNLKQCFAHHNERQAS